jgi:hypothetical protein
MERKRETNAELAARLNSDPGYLGRVAVREAERELRKERLRKELVPLVEEVRALGLVVDSLWELKQRPSDLRAAFPVLLRHLKRPYSKDALWSIANAFETREARPYWDAIVSLYEGTTDDPETREETWRSRLASAISEMAAKSDLPVLERLLRNPALGEGRLFLIHTVIKFGKDKGWALLRELARDPGLSKEIAYRLSEKERRDRAKEKRAR